MEATPNNGWGQRRGTSAWPLSKELGMSEDWCRQFFKRFRLQWKPLLAAASVKIPTAPQDPPDADVAQSTKPTPLVTKLIL